ncbi:MAG: NAD-dependent epimerase/dehydratase family protein [Sulfobacillus sp.]
MKVLVTGGTGYIGRRLVDVLIDKGFHVRIFGRQASNLSKSVEQVMGNLADLNALKDVTKDVEVVFHLGGGMRPSDEDVTVVNVHASRCLMQDAISNGVRRFIYVSAAAVYGDITSPPASEKTDCNPLPGHTYAVSKLQAEQHLLSLTNRKTDLIIIRLPQVYSAGSPSIKRFPQLASVVEGENTTHFVHREDAVRAILMLENSDYAPGIYNVADDKPLTVQDAATIINKALENIEMTTPQGTANIPPMLRRIMQATLVLDTSKVTRLGFSLKYPSLELGVYHDT